MASRQRDEFGLLERQRLFCDLYLADPDRNAAAQYRRAYPNSSARAAEASASNLLSQPKVKAYLRQRQDQILGRLNITQERITQEIARLAFSDIRKLFNEDGSLKAPHELDENTAAAIAGMDVTRTADGSAVTKIKMAAKGPELDKLAKMEGLYEKDNDQKKPDIVALTRFPKEPETIEEWLEQVDEIKRARAKQK